MLFFIPGVEEVFGRQRERRPQSAARRQKTPPGPEKPGPEAEPVKKAPESAEENLEPVKAAPEPVGAGRQVVEVDGDVDSEEAWQE